MDTTALVDNLIDDGKRLIEDLVQHGFEVTAAFWLQASEDDRWSFYVVSPIVDAEGLAQAYRRLHPVVYALPPSCGIDPLAIRLIGPTNPIAKDVLAIHSRAPGVRGCPSRWGGTRLGNVNVEGVYLYPLPATTSK